MSLLGLRKIVSTGDVPKTIDTCLVNELRNITANDMELLLALETQVRVDRQEEKLKQQQEEELKPILSRLKFDLPSTPPRPNNTKDLTMKRRWSLPINTNNYKRKLTWSRLFNKQQDTLSPSLVIVGSRVKLVKRPLPLIGTVKYIGQVHFDTGEWLGIELDYRGIPHLTFALLFRVTNDIT